MTLPEAPFCQGPDWEPRKSPQKPGTCGACGKPLQGRKLWFCPSPPGEAYDTARREAQSCRARYMRQHDWGEAQRAAIRRDNATCRHCGAHTDAPEVHHVVPRNGMGYSRGCHHHLDGLLTLCHKCHVETRRKKPQREPALAKHPSRVPNPAQCVMFE